MVNIFNLYVTINKYELNYFYKVVHFLQFMDFKPGVNVQIVHFDFKTNERVANITLNKRPLFVSVFTFSSTGKNMYQKYITNIRDIVDLYNPVSNGANVWIYSGHGGGNYLAKKNVRLLRIEDFCEIVYRVIGKPADLIIFDCCLCGSINCLYTCAINNSAKYVMAASSYQSYLSVMHTQSLYRFNDDIVTYCKGILKEMSSFEKVEREAYDTNFNIYQLTPAVLELAQLTLDYKDLFKLKKSFVIDNAKYKDLECCFSELGINIKPLLDDITLFTRYTKSKCVNVKQPRNKDTSIPSRLTVVLKRPKRKGLIITQGDIFFI
jgi:hypothetical protein